jgi:hypothetical protein
MGCLCDFKKKGLLISCCTQHNCINIYFRLLQEEHLALKDKAEKIASGL